MYFLKNRQKPAARAPVRIIVNSQPRRQVRIPAATVVEPKQPEVAKPTATRSVQGIAHLLSP